MCNHSAKNIIKPIIKTINDISCFLVFAILFGTSQYASADADTINNITRTLQGAVESKDFSALERFSPKEKLLIWGVCGSTDAEPEKLSADAMIKTLLKDSKDVKIYFNPEPEVMDFSEKSENKYVSIYTEGWTSEYPFLGFSFTVNKLANKWSWNGVCYSAEPPGRRNKTTGKTTYTWPRKPTLPRPGPRSFKTDETLRARIIEIVKFQAFDALKPYAINHKLILSECNSKMIENNDISGELVSIDQVIDLLKKNSRNSKKIRFVRGTYRYRDTEGWSGDYPYIAFWFSSGRNGWELSGLSYCTSPHFSLIFEGEEKAKYLKNLEKELNMQ